MISRRWREPMLVGRSKFWLACLLALSLVVAGGGGATPGAGSSVTPLSQDLPSSPPTPLTATSEPTLSATALSQVSPLPTPALELMPDGRVLADFAPTRPSASPRPRITTEVLILIADVVR